MKGMSNVKDTHNLTVILVLVPHCHTDGLSPFLALVNATGFSL